LSKTSWKTVLQSFAGSRETSVPKVAVEFWPYAELVISSIAVAITFTSSHCRFMTFMQMIALFTIFMQMIQCRAITSLYIDGFVCNLTPYYYKCRKVEDLQFTAEEAAIDRSDLEVIDLYCVL